MSRIAALLIAFAVPIWSPASAQADTAEEAQENFRRTFSLDRAAPTCVDQGDLENDIVVCARRKDQQHRLPLPAAPTPGGRLRGDVPNASAERGGAGVERCSTVGPNQQCGGGLPVIPMAVKAVEMVAKLIESDD